MESDDDDLEVVYESQLPSTSTTPSRKPQRTRKKSLEKVGLFPKLDDDPAKVNTTVKPNLTTTCQQRPFLEVPY